MAYRVEQLFCHTAVLILVALLAPACVLAQDPEPIVPIQFNFSDPGARSMGFGGAFVALADDATAAFANPAGLVQLARPEISIEGRRWSYSTPYTEGGRVEGLPSGIGLDSTVGLRTATSDETLTGLSFLSYVYPMEDWSLAVYRHELANFEFTSETQGFFVGGTDCCQVRLFDQRATTDLDLVSYGLSAAFQTSDKLSLGLGVIYYDASLDSTATVFGTDDDTVESVFAPNSYLPERVLLSQVSTLDDADWALSGGFLWQPSENWSVGGVYRQGAELVFGGKVTAGPLLDIGVPPGTVLGSASGVPLSLPDIYGLGFAYRAPDGQLTLSFQWDRVEYSDIADSLELEVDGETIDDVDELHLGAEYVLLGSTPVMAIRVGAWYEPDHQTRATNDDPYLRAILPRGDDEMHYAAGFGVATPSFQVDLGVDFADRVDTVSLSAIYSF